MSGSPALIDFHNHFVAPGFELNIGNNTGPEWDLIRDRLQDERAVLAEIESGDIEGRVLNSPAALLRPESVTPDTVKRLNDTLAEFVARHPGRLHGLVGVDIFAGDAAAREIERGIRDLGFKGVFVDSARGDLLIDAPEARAGLEVAHALGVPVFVHPINPEALTRQLAPYGRLGTRLARGTINAAALVALLNGGVFEKLPRLRIVVTTLAIGAVLLEAGFDPESRIRNGIAEALRRHVYIDTMGLDPGLLKVSVDLLGADHVLLGTDWPIVSEGPIRQRFKAAAAEAGLGPADVELIANGNARRILQINNN